MEITFTERGDAVGPEYHATIFAQRNGQTIGHLSYAYYDGEARLNMVEVEPAYRRQGIATALLQELVSQDPRTQITPTLFIGPEGEAWWHSARCTDG